MYHDEFLPRIKQYTNAHLSQLITNNYKRNKSHKKGLTYIWYKTRGFYQLPATSK